MVRSSHIPPNFCHPHATATVTATFSFKPFLSVPSDSQVKCGLSEDEAGLTPLVQPRGQSGAEQALSGLMNHTSVL